MMILDPTLTDMMSKLLSFLTLKTVLKYNCSVVDDLSNDSYLFPDVKEYSEENFGTLSFKVSILTSFYNNLQSDETIVHLKY